MGGEMKKIKLPKSFPYTNNLGQEIKDEQDFWNESFNKEILSTPYVFALANSNFEIMEWLQEKGVRAVKFPAETAQKILKYDGFFEQLSSTIKERGDSSIYGVSNTMLMLKDLLQKMIDDEVWIFIPKLSCNEIKMHKKRYLWNYF